MTRSPTVRIPALWRPLSRVLFSCFANIAEAAREPTQVSGKEDLVTSLVLFGLVAVAAGVAAYSANILRRSL